MRRSLAAVPVLFLLFAAEAAGGDLEDPAVPSFHGRGVGPRREGSVYDLFDATAVPRQSNAFAFAPAAPGPRASLRLVCKVRVPSAGDGGGFAFLSTAKHGARGPAPFVANWSEPNLPGTFAVGLDVDDPKSDDPFGREGNYLGEPERAVSLHWDGREVAKRLAPSEFRATDPTKDGFVDLQVDVVHVVGGAEVSVDLAGAKVFDRTFVPGLFPYEARLAFGASNANDERAAQFLVRDVAVSCGAEAAKVHAPLTVGVFNHVLTDNAKTAFETDAELPPLAWAFGRVMMNVEIHDAGDAWDEWDRCGEVSIVDPEGVKRGIVPFITSYRTPCRFQVDVTHFRPWLAGKVRFEVAAGTNFYKNRGYMMSVSLDFHHGAAAMEPFRVVPLWNGTAHYRSDENHFADFFGKLTVPIAADATSARLFVTTTGHSQVGEFTPSRRTIVVAPAADAAPVRFPSTVWKDDCRFNPNRPQYGTWKYARAGWAPGDYVRPLLVDLGGAVRPGAAATFAYEPEPYDFAGSDEKPTEKEKAEASHNVRSYLILYRATGEHAPAPTLRVLDVSAGGIAAKAGLSGGDYLASYDGRALDSIADLRDAIAAASTAGKTAVEIVTWRGTERRTASVAPGRLGVGLAER